MKQKILDIMDDKIFIEYYGIHGKGHAAEEIAQMMCDEILKIMKIVESASAQETVNQVIYLHKIGFTEDQIDNALNKLK